MSKAQDILRITLWDKSVWKSQDITTAVDYFLKTIYLQEPDTFTLAVLIAQGYIRMEFCSPDEIKALEKVGLTEERMFRKNYYTLLNLCAFVSIEGEKEDDMEWKAQFVDPREYPKNVPQKVSSAQKP